MALQTSTTRPVMPEAGLPGGGSYGGTSRWARGLVGLLTVTVLGCGIADEAPLPPNVEDPATLQTPSGAMARYRETVAELGGAFDRVMTVGGAMTDELTALPLPLSVGGAFTAIDSRQDLTDVNEILSKRLYRLRAQAREARGFIKAYAPDSSPALGAHLAAIEGYAELFLADLFCSGIPLSTVDFNGDYTLAAGSTTREVYQNAVTLFDTALAQASDSVRFQHLAAVGRGRALLALGRYAEAAAAVTAVPDDYRFQTSLRYSTTTFGGVSDSASLFWFTNSSNGRTGALSMGDQEGGVGLAYLSDNDPRTLPWTQDLQDPTGNRMYFPRKYTPNDSGAAPTSPATFTVASGVEARLIEAEAALAAGSSTWLTILNALRTAGTFDTQPNAGNPAINDTLWHAGKGGVAGLRPLDDPGTMDARVDLVFRERAFWLYLTAQRQGDLRRLIRDYQREAETVYPNGSYAGGAGAYGTEITVPMPTSERKLNPKYTGCFHRNA